MRIGTLTKPATSAAAWAADVAELESLGLDEIHVAEAYGFDAVSQLGYLASVTERVTLVSGILQFFSRTPTLVATTAATLDTLSGGRFRLGLGASGPQVVEGFHGVPYTAPIARTREVVEICREVWRGEKVRHEGGHYRVPLSPDRGTGLGKPLAMLDRPLRTAIPIALAAVGPRNVEVAAEIAEGWAPTFFAPEKAGEVWGDALRAGAARRDPALGQLEVCASASLAIDDDLDHARDLVRPHLALYVGGMGARGRNFYHDLVRRYGFGEAAETIQDLYLAGRRTEAAAAVPDELVDLTALVGPPARVAERLHTYAEAGVTTICARPAQQDPDLGIVQLGRLVELAP